MKKFLIILGIILALSIIVIVINPYGVGFVIGSIAGFIYKIFKF